MVACVVGQMVAGVVDVVWCGGHRRVMQATNREMGA
jgi:hypothetical protein